MAQNMNVVILEGATGTDRVKKSGNGGTGALSTGNRNRAFCGEGRYDDSCVFNMEKIGRMCHNNLRDN